MRLLTRGDADGLCCAVFFKEKEKIDSIEFVHPKDMQDGKIKVSSSDILANLPFHPDCGMWFDHHASNSHYTEKFKYKGNFRVAPSAARVVYEYYKDPQLDKYLRLLEETDRMDSATLTVEDVTKPEGYILIMYTLDPRSGLGPFKDYFLKLLEWIINKPVEEILKIPEVKDRCDRLFSEQIRFGEVMKANSRVEENVIITDLRKTQGIPPGNRFYIFTLFPKGNVQMRIFNGKAGEFIVVALGHSIFNRTCKVDLGALAAKYGGGGHKGASTCQLPVDKADNIIPEIANSLKEK